METPIIPNIVPKDWEAQRAKIAKDLDDLATKAEKVVVRLDPTSLKSAQGVVEQYSKSITDLTRMEQVRIATMRERQALQQREVTLSAQVNNAATSEAANIAALNLTKKELNRVTALQVQLQTSEAGSYNALAAEYGLNVIQLNKYSQAQIEASTRLKTMQQRAFELREEMARLKAATNDGTLRVGQYERALGHTAKNSNNAYLQTFQLTQVMRELPNFAIDARVGFMAISNNLPMLAEGFSNLSRSIDSTTGKMLGTVGAAKIFARSLLSLNTIMIVFSSLLVLLNNKKFTEWIDKIINKTTEAERVTKDFLKTLKDGSSGFKSTLESVSKVDASMALYNDGLIDGKTFLAEFNKELGAFYGKQTSAADAVEAFTKLTPSYLKAMQLQAEANVALQLAVDAAMKKEAERANTTVTGWQKTAYSFKALGKLIGDAFLNPFKIPEYGRYFRSMANAGDEILGAREAKAQEWEDIERSRIQKHIDLLKESYAELSESGLKNGREAEELAAKSTSEMTAVERDRYEKSLFYTTNRLKVERRLFELETQLSKTTAEGVLNDYSKREDAAREYHQVKTELLDIELAADKKKAEEELRSDEKKITNLLKAYKGGQDKLIYEQTLSDGTVVKLTKEMNDQLLRMRENHSVTMLKAQDKYDMELLGSARELSENLRSVQEDRYADEVYRLKVSNEEKLQLIKEFAEKQRIEAEKLTPTEVVALAFGVERDDDFSALAIDHEENQRRLEEQLRFINEQLAAVQKGTDEEKQLYRDLAEAERQIEDEKREYMLASLRMVTEKTKEAYKEMATSIKDAVTGIVDAYNDTQRKRTDEESERLNKERDERINRLDEEAMTEEAITKEKERINDEYDKKQAQLEEEQAKRERNAFLLQQGLALASIWVKYGQTIAAYTLAEAELAAALAVILGPAAPAAAIAAYAPLKTAATVSAGANTALIAAQTIPSFAEGGVMEQTGTALVGDATLFGKPKRREVLLYPSGCLSLTPDSPTLMNLPKGTTVYPDADRLPTLRDIERKIIVNSIFNSKEIVDELRTLVAVTNKKPRLIDQADLRRQYRQ
jgi:preprotein translocase subunit SecG